MSIRDWPIWSLPRAARAYVIAVPVVAAVALGVAAARTNWHVSQLGIFFLLLASAAAMVEATRDVKLPRDTLTRDLQEVWYLSIAAAAAAGLRAADPDPAGDHEAVAGAP